MALQDAGFAVARDRLETIFAQPSRYDEAAADASSEIPQWTRAMADELKSMVHDMPSGDYVAAKTFLKRLEYESRFAAPAVGLAAR